MVVIYLMSLYSTEVNAVTKKNIIGVKFQPVVTLQLYERQLQIQGHQHKPQLPAVIIIYILLGSLDNCEVLSFYVCYY